MAHFGTTILNWLSCKARYDTVEQNRIFPDLCSYRFYDAGIWNCASAGHFAILSAYAVMVLLWAADCYVAELFALAEARCRYR